MASAKVVARVAMAALASLVLTAAGCTADQGAPAPRVVSSDCPAVMPGTSNGNQDFADLLVWGGRTYVSGIASSSPVQSGAEIGSVTCSLVDGPLRAVREGLVHPPWPDGTATGLTQGTTIFAVRDVSTSCMLAARREGKLVSYTAVDTDDSSWPQLC